MRIPQGQPTVLGQQFINLAPAVTSAILQTIAMGWELAAQRSEVNPGAGEVMLTECLRDAMRGALESADLPWRRTMVILPGTESRSQGGMTAPDGRTDIPVLSVRIFASVGEHDPHAIIECKRVAEGNAHLAREYVIEGIDRFTNGKYGGNHSHGFMIGYVLSGNRVTIVAGINSYLSHLARTQESLMPMHGEQDLEQWSSCHPRSSQSTQITLYHTMLLVT